MRRLSTIAAVIAIGCGDRPAPPPSASVAAASPPAPTVSARRPARRYYLSRTASRCEIYRVDDDGISPPTETPCPIDLYVGESIRIVGKTCQRESSDLERVEPIVCPDPLTNREKRDLGPAR